MDSKRHEAYRTAILRAQGVPLEGIYPRMTRVVEAVVAVADAETASLREELEVAEDAAHWNTLEAERLKGKLRDSQLCSMEVLDELAGAEAEVEGLAQEKWAEYDRAQALLEENTRLSDALEAADLRFQREVESLKLAHSKVVNALREELARDQ